jgi:hypothetical protein
VNTGNVLAAKLKAFPVFPRRLKRRSLGFCTIWLATP